MRQCVIIGMVLRERISYKNRGTDRGIAVVFWDDPEDMDHNRNAKVDAILEEMSHLFLTAPKTGFYEVSSEIEKSVPVAG